MNEQNRFRSDLVFMVCACGNGKHPLAGMYGPFEMRKEANAECETGLEHIVHVRRDIYLTVVEDDKAVQS